MMLKRQLILYYTSLVAAIIGIVSGGDIPHPLYVLSLLPYSDSSGKYGWDHGLELLPAARVAVKHINNRTDILPGYEIRLIERASDACGKTIVTKGLLNFVGNVLKHYEDDVHGPIAVVGLACSTVTAAVSPIASRYGILQMSMASSTSFREKQQFPHLWRFLSSSDQLVKAVVSLMEENGWDRIGMVSDGRPLMFDSIAQSFRKIVRLKNFTLTFDKTINANNHPSIMVDYIKEIKARIIFAPLNVKESIKLMCQAVKLDVVWPGYVWIFPSLQYQYLIQRDGILRICNVNSSAYGLENTVFLDFAIHGRNDNVPMTSGKTYSQYREDYDNEYMNIQRQYDGSGIEFSSTYNIYANPMYDELWALVLALNRSLDELRENSLDLKDYYRGNVSQITKIVEHNLKNITFSGTFGNAYFNEFNEVPVNVNIFHIRNQTPIKIAVYDEKRASIFIVNNESFQGFDPNDEFDNIQYNFVSTTIAIILYINSIILLLVTTVSMCMSLILRNEPELLSTNLLLSIPIFIGCYQLILVSFLSVTQDFIELSSDIYIVFCYLQAFLSYSGMPMVAGTVLTRLIRIHRIFSLHYGNLSKIWGNKYLFVTVLCMSFAPCVFLAICYPVDPLYEFYEDLNSNGLIRRCDYDASHIPICAVSHTLILFYIGVILFFLALFAVLTRKVNKQNFKDTKKVAAFVFFFVIVSTLMLVLFAVHEYSYIQHSDSSIVLSFLHQTLVLLSLVFLVLPKLLPAVYYRVLKKQKRDFQARLAEKKSDNGGITFNVFKKYHNTK